LYIEKYRTFCAGVFGERIDCYLTDSVSFRQLIGSSDEHDFLFAKKDGSKLEVDNVESGFYNDTTERKTISANALFARHDNDSNRLTSPPLFGKNTIKCNDDFYPASSYKTEDGNYMSEIQYHCGNDYLNAVYYTDSLHFRVFIGVYSPGSFLNNYSVQSKGNKEFEFFNIENKRKTDTTRRTTYLLSDLRKNGLITVCK
jgi:hypothetical protein